jgi:hypothetical protein
VTEHEVASVLARGQRILPLLADGARGDQPGEGHRRLQKALKNHDGVDAEDDADDVLLRGVESLPFTTFSSSECRRRPASTYTNDVSQSVGVSASVEALGRSIGAEAHRVQYPFDLEVF